MSGYARDLALINPWEASLQRSRARRRRAAKGHAATLAKLSPISLAALIEARREAMRDLAEHEPWDVSLGRSRARRRAADLRFVPASTRARRLSLGALVALAAPASTLLESSGGTAIAGAAPFEPGTGELSSTSHHLVLSAGSEGRHVRLLQRALGLPIDGVYGPATEAAVRRFQVSRGLPVDGIVGSRTARALAVHAPPVLSGAAIVRALDGEAHETAPGEVTEAAPAAAAGVAAASTGAAVAPSAGTAEVSTGGAVALATTGTGGTAVAPGGAPVAATSAEAATPQSPAVQAASTTTEAVAVEAGGTPGEAEVPDGVRAAVTLEGTGGSVTPGEPEPPAEGVPGAEASGATVAQEGEAVAEAAEARAATQAVRRLQSALHVAVDGEFGPATEAALRRLQAHAGLTVDGVAGPTTWHALGVHGQPELTPPPSALPQPHPHHAGGAHAGGAAGTGAGTGEATGGGGGAGGAGADGGNGGHVSRGEAIRALQAALQVPVDGDLGSETEAAIRHFQSAHGLEADGVVGPATWSALGLSGPELHPPHAAGGGGSSSSGSSSSTGGEGEGVIARVIAAADEIATRPYVYGGGHGSFTSYGYDCSGSVSYALHGGGLLSSPEDSSALESYGEPGPGRYITIYANAEHAWMTIDGRRYDTVALAESGSRWSGSMASTGGYVVRHPDGL